LTDLTIIFERQCVNSDLPIHAFITIPNSQRMAEKVEEEKGTKIKFDTASDKPACSANCKHIHSREK